MTLCRVRAEIDRLAMRDWRQPELLHYNWQANPMAFGKLGHAL
jgi:hypothetical protein